jgi:4-alpha-glucanotransferase
MDELKALGALAEALGVYTHYTDGLHQPVTVAPETLLRVCAALGAPVESPSDAAEALRAYHAAEESRRLPSALVAWDGALTPVTISSGGRIDAELHLEGGEVVPLEIGAGELRATRPLPFGYHRLTVEVSGATETCTVIAAPLHAWRRSESRRSWGVGAQLAALRSARSRSLGDLRDLESVCRWLGERGGDLVMVLPLLPTFNGEPPEPSPYSPVSRLFCFRTRRCWTTSWCATRVSVARRPGWAGTGGTGRRRRGPGSWSPSTSTGKRSVSISWPRRG